VELAVIDDFIELENFLRGLLYQLVIHIAAFRGLTVTILTATTGTLDVPHNHRGVIGADERLSVSAL